MTNSSSSASRRGDPREPHLDHIDVAGQVSEEDLEAVKIALEQIIAAERRAQGSSVWLRAARSQGRRLGMSDYRDRFNRDDAWRLSTRFPFGGREYPGLVGRGDAR